MLAEFLDMLDLAFANETFDYQGEHYSLPSTHISARPVNGVPDIWIAGDHEFGHRLCARKGYVPMFTGRWLGADYQRQQRDSGKEAEALMARAKTEAEAHRKASAALAEVLARQEQMMTEKIARAEAAAVQQVRSHAVMLAMAATVKLLESKLTGAAGDALIDTAIGALPDRLH